MSVIDNLLQVSKGIIDQKIGSIFFSFKEIWSVLKDSPHFIKSKALLLIPENAAIVEMGRKMKEGTS
jgi:hypothetical protein